MRPTSAQTTNGAEDAIALDPSALSRFGRLELIARLVVEGVNSGLHKSPFKGFSVEFAEHRQYGPGDEIRHIDWRAYGKSDRYFVKEYEEETNLKAYLVVDNSASMSYAGKTISKLEQAKRLAASLAYLMISQRDAVGLATFDRGLESMIPARSAAGHFSVICRELEGKRASGETSPSAILHSLAERIRRRALVVLISDGFDKIEDISSAFKHLRHNRHETLFLHVLAPEEETFPFQSPARFRDVESTGKLLRVDPAVLRAAYLEKFRAFQKGLQDAVFGSHADYFMVSTATDPTKALLDYLSERAGGRRVGGRS